MDIRNVKPLELTFDISKNFDKIFFPLSIIVQWENGEMETALI